jgi:hypothetical protein
MRGSGRSTAARAAKGDLPGKPRGYRHPVEDERQARGLVTPTCRVCGRPGREHGRCIGCDARLIGARSQDQARMDQIFGRLGTRTRPEPSDRRETGPQ